MVLKFLPNTHAADPNTSYTGMGSVNGLVPDTGYQASFGIVANRDWYFKMASGASSFGFGWASGAGQPDYLVLAGAHKLLTSAGMRVSAYRSDATPTYTQIDDFNPIARTDLIGRYKQDLLVSVPVDTNNDRHGFRFDSLGTESAMFSSIFVSSAFDFGTNPATGGVRITMEEDEWRPRFSSLKYKTEAKLDMVFQGVTQTKCEEFKSLVNLYDWPMFIYDEDGDVFPYNLEHVVLEEYQESRLAADDYTVVLRFQRLKHYD